MSCSRDVLDRTIFIPDPEDANLPVYSEWGYNSFGAIHERNYFVSTSNIVPCKIVYDNGRLEFSLSGQYSMRTTTLTFSFPISEIKNLEDLAVLHDLNVNLSENSTVIWDGVQVTVITGKLHFKRFQLLRVDEKLNRIILSGVFEMRFLRNGLPETISEGRFDMGITGRDFHSFAN